MLLLRISPEALICAPQQCGAPLAVFLGRFLPKLGGASRCRLFFAVSGPGRPAVARFRREGERDRPCHAAEYSSGHEIVRGIEAGWPGHHLKRLQNAVVRFSQKRVLTLGRSGVISRPPQRGDPASPGQPETLRRQRQGPRVKDQVAEVSGLHALGHALFVLQQCRVFLFGSPRPFGAGALVAGTRSLTIASVFWKQAHAVVVSCSLDPVIRICR